MNRCLSFATLVLALPTLAAAATVASSNIACKLEADSKKLVDFDAKKDAAGRTKFSAPKLAAGDCSSLPKGMTVDIDKKDGQLLCVRPAGGFECYWAADATINQKPAAEQETHAAPGGRHRGGGNRSPMP